MAEYIEREKTVELLRSLGNRGYRKEKSTIQDAIKMISFPEYTPTADVVPVVRCRDCAYLFETLCAVCGLLPRQPDDFCSRGERKENADHEAD